MESSCKENLGCLKTVLDSQNGYLRNEKYSKQIRGEYDQLINFILFLYIIIALYLLFWPEKTCSVAYFF